MHDYLRPRYASLSIPTWELLIKVCTSPAPTAENKVGLNKENRPKLGTVRTDSLVSNFECGARFEYNQNVTHGNDQKPGFEL